MTFGSVDRRQIDPNPLRRALPCSARCNGRCNEIRFYPEPPQRGCEKAPSYSSRTWDWDILAGVTIALWPKRSRTRPAG